MFQIRKSGTYPLTRELVTRFSMMTPSATEREFREDRLQYLQNIYDAGKWLPCQWASVWLGGTEFRMNGQHSSAMLVKLPDPFPTHLSAHVDEYEAETAEDVISLFRQFDPRKSARSALDVSGAYQYSYPELHDIPSRTAKVAIEGIAWYLDKIEGFPVGKGDERYQLFNRPVYYDFLHWTGILLDSKTPELKKVEIIAAMYATEEKSGTERSRTFWEEVARGGRPFEEQHPTTVLDKWLKSCHEKTCDDPMKTSFHYQGCIYGWNACREERSIKDIRFQTSKGLYIPHE